MINPQRKFPGGSWPEGDGAMLKAGPEDIVKVSQYITNHYWDRKHTHEYQALVDHCKELALESRRPLAIHLALRDFEVGDDWIDKAGEVLLEGPPDKDAIDIDDDWLFFVAMFAKNEKGGVWDEGADVIWEWASEEMAEHYLYLGDFFKADEYHKRRDLERMKEEADSGQPARGSFR